MRAALRAGRYLHEIPANRAARPSQRTRRRGARHTALLAAHPPLALWPGRPRYDAEVLTGHAQGRDQFPYPSGSVVGGFVDEPASASARERLARAGFGPDDYQVLHGEGDAGRIDITGDAHGTMGRLFRRLQDAVTDEGDEVRRYAEYLRGGHYLVAVRVGDDEAAKQSAAGALYEADAQFLTYYAANYIEDLGGNA